MALGCLGSKLNTMLVIKCCRRDEWRHVIDFVHLLCKKNTLILIDSLILCLITYNLSFSTKDGDITGLVCMNMCVCDFCWDELYYINSCKMWVPPEPFFETMEKTRKHTRVHWPVTQKVEIMCEQGHDLLDNRNIAMAETPTMCLTWKLVSHNILLW